MNHDTDVKKETFEECVPLNEIFWDERYGREPSALHIRRLADAWDDGLVGVLYLSLRKNGKYCCLDGWHRVQAAKLRRVECLPARVWIDLTLEQEALKFDQVNRRRVTVLPIESFKARLVYKDKVACKIDELVSALGLRIAAHRSDRKGIRAVARLEQVYTRLGQDAFLVGLSILRQAFEFNQSGYVDAAIGGMCDFWVRYADVVDRKRLVQVLKEQGPDGMIIRSRQLRAITPGVDGVTCWGMALLAVYNHGLRSNQLSPWTAKAYAKKAVNTLREKAAKAPRRRGRFAAKGA